MNPNQVITNKAASDNEFCSAQIAKELQKNGYAWIRALFDGKEVEAIKNSFEEYSESKDLRKRNGKVFGVRNLLQTNPTVQNVANRSKLTSCIKKLSNIRTKAIKALFFDKIPGANWKVFWHQDLTIAVDKKQEIPEFGPWSIKGGIVHVQPPISILENILTSRIHLDDCSEENGPLMIIPETHQLKLIPSSEIQDLAKKEKVVVCTAKAGDILLMKPLLLHSSLSSQKPLHRRVLHIEYSADRLPKELNWAL
jgi:ectoine hydroxylase-related dioxygenase (phytanoyl-CoA dioxygenase family)